MHISEILTQHNPSFSFEFFPPKNEKSAATLYNTISKLMPLQPAYVSVTYGAGGSTRDLTHDLVLKIQKETNLTVVSHLTCVNSTRDEIYAILKDYNENGIHNIMALRGDPPAGEEEFTQTEGGFAQAAEMVAFIKEHFPNMGIGVAGFPEGHPATPNRLKEIEYLKQKVDAGADYICTQLFFDNNEFYDFRERCELAGIDIPIIAGIMPITARKGMERMAELSGGTRFPAKLLRSLNRTDSAEHFANVGINWAIQQVQDLVDNKVRGIHFYTLNQSNATQQIYDGLGVKDSSQLGS